MRADLQTMEQIDLYLQGKMSAAESAVFESNMAIDPELGQLVADQQLLAQTVSRKALLAEITLVAGGGGGAWYSNPWVGFAGATIVVGIIAAAIYYSTNDETNELIVENNSTEQTIENNQTTIYETSTIEYKNDSVNNSNTSDERKITHNSHTINGTNEIVDGNNQNKLDDGNVSNFDANDNPNNVTGPTTKLDLTDRRVINKSACFPKGYQAMRSYVTEKVIYPGTAKKEKIQGNVKVQFFVGKEGQISEIVANCFKMRDANNLELSATQMVLNSKIAKLFEDKCLATIRTMPSWEPATDSQGNAVLSTVTVYFNFSLYDGITIYQTED